MKKLSASVLLLLGTLFLVAQVPSNYYLSAEGKSGKELKTALHNIIRQGKRLGYGSGSGKTWSGFEVADLHPDGYVWDMYSLNKRFFPGGAKAPGGMNIEHSVAKSWWGGTNNDAYKDLYHLNPSDIAANSARSNYPLGINNGSTFSNGSIKVGKNTYGTEYSGLSFEPLDEYKGDFARAYLYMFTCYENFTWTGTSAPSMLVAHETWPMLRNWARNMLLEWHYNDPVSRKERNRMEAIYKLQSNRNPYIDHPELVGFIWGTSSTQPWYPGEEVVDPDPELPDTTSEFVALPATKIHYNRFTANWTAAPDATSYQLNVFTIEETETSEPESILNIDFSDGVPAGWTTTGYTDTNTAGSLRLASGSNQGTINSEELDLSSENLVLVVRARQYSNDTGATLSVSVDNQLVAEWNTEKENKNYTVSLPSTTSTSTISFSAKSNRRVYIDNITLSGSTHSYKTISIPGFPVMVHDSLSYQVTGLEPGVEYYYTISAAGNPSATTSAIPVTTLITSSTNDYKPAHSTLNATTEGLQITIQDEHTRVRIVSTSGKQIVNNNYSSGTYEIALPAKGIYLIQLTGNNQTSTYKLIF